MVVEENNPFGHILDGQEYPANSALPFNVETSLSNNFIGDDSENPYAQWISSLPFMDSDLNAATHGLAPVDVAISDIHTFMAENCQELIRSTDQIQPITLQNFNEPTEVNFNSFQDAQSDMQPDNVVQQQQLCVIPPPPSANPLLKYVQVGEKTVLALCKKEDLPLIQPRPANSLVAPLFHQAPSATILTDQHFQVPTRPANYTNLEYCNPYQSLPGPSIPRRILMDAPNEPTLRMGFYGQNSQNGHRNTIVEVPAWPANYANKENCNPSQSIPSHKRKAKRKVSYGKVPTGPANNTNLGNCNPSQSMPRDIPMDVSSQPTPRMGFHGENSSLAPTEPEIADTPRDEAYPTANLDPVDSDSLLRRRLQSKDSIELIINALTRDVLGEVIKPINKQPCGCSKSQCLQLFCTCFAAGGFCQDACSCNNCFNNLEHEQIRSEVLKDILKRKPKAFTRKLRESEGARGCKCKVSNCKKYYCECLAANLPCSTSTCKCVNCNNRPIDDELNKNNPDGKNKTNEAAQFLSLFNEDVMDSAIESMLTAAAKHPGDERAGLMRSMKEFSSCFNEITDAHRQIQANAAERKYAEENVEKNSRNKRKKHGM